MLLILSVTGTPMAFGVRQVFYGSNWCRNSAKKGAASSLVDSFGAEIGHATPSSGSFQRMEPSSSGW